MLELWDKVGGEEMAEMVQSLKCRVVNFLIPYLGLKVWEELLEFDSCGRVGGKGRG